MMAKKGPHRRKRAAGGKVDKKVENTVNDQGSPAMAAAHKTKGDGFKRGGHVDGEKSMPRLDRRARGGHVKMARGGSPMSSAHALSAPDAKSGAGHEGEAVKDGP